MSRSFENDGEESTKITKKKTRNIAWLVISQKQNW